MVDLLGTRCLRTSRLHGSRMGSSSACPCVGSTWPGTGVGNSRIAGSNPVASRLHNVVASPLGFGPYLLSLGGGFVLAPYSCDVGFSLDLQLGKLATGPFTD